MDAAQASSIIAEAKNLGVFKGDMPEDEGKRAKEAERIVKQAEAAERAGVKGDAVKRILALASGEQLEPTQPSESSSEDETKEDTNYAPAEGLEEAPPTEEGAPQDEGGTQREEKGEEAAADPGEAGSEEPEGRAPEDGRSRGGLNPDGKKGYEYECPECEYACGSARGLKRHMNKEHEGRDFEPGGGDLAGSQPPSGPESEPESSGPEETSTQPMGTDTAGDGGDSSPRATPSAATPSELVAQTLEGGERGSSASEDVEQGEAPAPSPSSSSIGEAIEYVHTQRALDFVHRENLPEPPEIKGDPPRLPQDMSSLPEQELRKLHSEFNACSARTRYLLSLEESKASDAKRVAKRRLQQVVARLPKYDEKNKQKAVTLLEAEAYTQDEKLREWKETEAQHYENARVLRAMLEGYDLDCDRISRQSSMRVQELGQSTPPRTSA